MKTLIGLFAVLVLVGCGSPEPSASDSKAAENGFTRKLTQDEINRAQAAPPTPDKSK